MSKTINEHKIHTHEALVLFSPLVHGEEVKNQDRAIWYGSQQVACVCDGVTSSPCSEQAAELSAVCSPALFKGPIRERLHMVCDLLLSRRQEYLAKSHTEAPDDTSPVMQKLLNEIIQEKKQVAFQTTLVAAQFSRDQDDTRVHLVKCGDSAFIAFSPDGELLATTLTDSIASKPQPRSGSSCYTQGVSFVPGTQILVRIEGDLADHAPMARKAGIKKRHLSNWLVSSFVEHCPDQHDLTHTHVISSPSLALRQGDILLIPKYLYGTELSGDEQQHYRCLTYSTAIRSPGNAMSCKRFESFSQNGSATKVLPDHGHNDEFESIIDTYPADTHFILCSDGFHGGFVNWSQMFRWLNRNRSSLLNNVDIPEILTGLHQNLSEHGGDDDISMIWIYPHRTPQSENNNVF